MRKEEVNLITKVDYYKPPESIDYVIDGSHSHSAESFANFLRSEGLSVRASNCLKRAGITNIDELISELTSMDEILAIRNSGQLTAEELWRFIRKIKTEFPAYEKEADQTPMQVLETSQDLPIFIPLVNVKISEQTWEMFQNAPVHLINWSVRIRNVIDRKGFQTLAELVKLSPSKWLKLKNFGKKSLSELEDNITELINNPSLLEKNLDETEVPLLKTKVSSEVWNMLKNIPVYSITWSVRIRNVIDREGFQTLADIVKLSPSEWLKLKNFGRKSLTELKEKASEVIACPDHFSYTDEDFIKFFAPKIESFKELGHFALKRIRESWQEVIKHLYGFADSPKNLRETGDILGVSRERVRQIKEEANAKINNRSERDLITTAISDLLSDSVSSHLKSVGGLCQISDLRQIISKKCGCKHEQQWIISWFDEAFGEDWICSYSDAYEVKNGVCSLKSEGKRYDFLGYLVSSLKRYGYRPLTLDQCVQLNRKTSDLPLKRDQILGILEKHSNLKVYQYGETYIGLSKWTWFIPEDPSSINGQADLIEWFLRMTNKPTTAKKIANGMSEMIGNFGLTPFEVVSACESQAYRFEIDEKHCYSLSLWKSAPKYQQDLTDLLRDSSLSVEQIIESLSLEESEQISQIVDALNFYQEIFVEISPFEWALKSKAKSKEMETDFDYTDLSFEDLIPK